MQKHNQGGLLSGEYPALAQYGSTIQQSGGLAAADSDRKRKTLAAAAVLGLLTTVAICLALFLDPRHDVATDISQLLQQSQPSKYSTYLQQPEVRRSADGQLHTTLRVSAGPVTTGPVEYTVRMYEGCAPGPTLVVRPGDQLQIDLVNHLEPPDCPPEQLLAMGDPNTTNIHVHGMHVSPVGIADNIYRRAGPGDTLKFVYDIPKHHFTGLFYYHPHHAGSSTMQLLGGMAGAIVVEDCPGDLAPQIEAMDSLVLVLQEVNLVSGTFRNYVSVQEASHSKMALWAPRGEQGSDQHFVAVNGQFQPKVALVAGEAVRLRIVHAGINDYFHLAEPAGACTMHCLARDGVYHDRPRLVQQGILMAPGSRAEVALTCHSQGTYTLVSNATEAGMQYLGSGTDVFQGTIMFLEVSPAESRDEGSSVEDAGADFGSIRIHNGPGQQDLSKLPPDRVSRFIYEFNQADKVRKGDFDYRWYGVNGQQYSEDTVMRRVPLDTVEEWVVVNAWLGREGGVAGPEGQEISRAQEASLEPTTVSHPFHLHVNHFQIVASSHPAVGDFEVGDWRDTISLPAPGNVTVRWAAKDFLGKSVAHCHIFSHSDTGMMMNFLVY